MDTNNSVPDFAFVDYQPEMAKEINALWRLSFDLALGIHKRGDRDSFDDQLRYLSHQLAKQTTILVALDQTNSAIAGFIALSKAEIDQLYIHPDYQRKGLGQRFVNIAKEGSGGSLSLYTFQLNKSAQRFYEVMGFTEVARGCAEMGNNPWADSESQLKDIKYLWSQKK